MAIYKLMHFGARVLGRILLGEQARMHARRVLGCLLFFGVFFATLPAQQPVTETVSLFEPGTAEAAVRALAAGGPAADFRVLRESGIQASPAALQQLFREELPAARASVGATTASAAAPRGTVRYGASRRQAALPSIELRLFPDTVFTVLPLRVLDRYSLDDAPDRQTRRLGRSITGVLVAGGEGTAILSEYQGALSASVRLTNGEFYELELLPPGSATKEIAAIGTVRQLEYGGRQPGSDEVVIPEDDDLDFPVAKPAPASLLEDARARFAGGEKIITVGIYYTRRMLEGRGGTSGLFSYLRRIEEESNAVMRNSGLEQEFRFVSATLVPYDDTESNMSYHVGLSTLRNTYDAAAPVRARLAVLFVDPPLPTSGRFTVGVAYVRIAFGPAQKYSVVHQRYAGGLSLTFAHEAGHSFGCVHDSANGGVQGGLFGDSRGYQQTELTPKFYTVMAYSCSGCQAVPYFSEPALLYQSLPLGTNDTRCAATIAREATDETWQAAPPPAGCVVEVYPATVWASHQAQDLQVEVRTSANCAWDVSSGQGGDRIEDLDAGLARSGPGWLRLRLPPNLTSGEFTSVLQVRGVPLRIVQHGAGSGVLASSSQLLQFEASTLPDSAQERCVYLDHSHGASSLIVQTAGLPAWLSMDREVVELPGFLGAPVNSAGVSSGNHRAAVKLSTASETPVEILLSVELRVASNVARMLLAPRAFAFRATPGSPVTAPQSLEVSGPVSLELNPLSGPPAWLRVESEPHAEGHRALVWADATGLADGVYLARLLVGCPNDSCAPRVVRVRLEVAAAQGSGPRIDSGGIVNAASFAPGLSVGSWMSMFGAGLAASTRAWNSEDFVGIVLPTSLDGVRVFVDGIAAPISFISPGQINFQCPELDRSGWVEVKVEHASGSDLHYAYAEPMNPGVFLLGDIGAVAALHEDTTTAAQEGTIAPGVAARSARSGDIISLYGTGFGQTTPRVFAGELYEGAARIPPSAATRVFIGGKQATILFAGQSAAGLNQVNLRVPTLPPGDHLVRVVVGSSPSAWRGTLHIE